MAYIHSTLGAATAMHPVDLTIILIWGPIFEKCRAENPGFKPNQDFRRDMFNLAVGLVWQTSLVAMPIYLVIQQFGRMSLCLAIFTATSVILKFSWYNKLGPGEMYMDEKS